MYYLLVLSNYTSKDHEAVPAWLDDDIQVLSSKKEIQLQKVLLHPDWHNRHKIWV
jgi:hypothetical protein